MATSTPSSLSYGTSGRVPKIILIFQEKLIQS
nr:MAG TPA: hypothetical protein [Caudoviricetes sp.]